MKLNECSHPKENPYLCECSNECSCKSSSCQKPASGYEHHDLDMKAVLRERDTKKFPPVKSVKLESCQKCGKESSKIVWEAVCGGCTSSPQREQQSALVQIFAKLSESLNHHGLIGWFLEPKSALQGRSPSRAIDDGDIKDVLSLIKERN